MRCNHHSHENIGYLPFAGFGLSHQCNFEAVEGQSHCLIHIDSEKRNDLGYSIEDVHQLLQEKLNNDGELVISGANLEIFNPDYIGVDSPISSIEISNSSINSLYLSEIDVDFSFSLKNCTVDNFDVSNSVFQKEVDIIETDIGSFNAQYTTFEHWVSFQATDFHETALFTECEFQSFAAFSPRPSAYNHFRMEPDLKAMAQASTFHKYVDFISCDFNGTTRFYGVDFHGLATFEKSTFRGSSNFSACKFSTVGNFFETEFHDQATFHTTSFGYGHFNGAVFHGITVFTESSFESTLRFYSKERTRSHLYAEGITHVPTESILTSRTPNLLVSSADYPRISGNFDDATFNGKLVFDQVRLRYPVDFRNMDVQDIDISLCPETDLAPISMESAKLRSGRFDLGSSDNLSFDLRYSSIGDITFESTLSNNIFHQVNLHRATFDGFDFTKYRGDLIENDWSLHTFASDNVENDPSSIELLYLRAKKAAQELGDTKSQSEFFIKEMMWRRKRYTRKIESKEDIFSNLRRAFFNWFLCKLCYYGERSSLVMRWVFVIIFFFSLVYWKVGVELPYTYSVAHPLLDTLPLFNSSRSISLEYLVFSIEVFTTFWLGGANISDPFIRFLAALEGFLGAFSVALLVFTLTRSLQR